MADPLVFGGRSRTRSMAGILHRGREVARGRFPRFLIEKCAIACGGFNEKPARSCTGNAPVDGWSNSSSPALRAGTPDSESRIPAASGGLPTRRIGVPASIRAVGAFILQEVVVVLARLA